MYALLRIALPHLEKDRHLHFGTPLHFPVNTKHYLEVDSTFFERYGRQMDVKTTLCACWVITLSDTGAMITLRTRG